MPLTALIIDDEQLAREELAYLLDQVGGVEVVAQGANGIEAVELIEEHHPDMVFLDVQMPGLDGFAVIQKLMDAPARRRRAGAEPLPQIVFATAYDQYAVRAFDVNAVDYLLKPFDRARIEQAVERVRGGWLAVPPMARPALCRSRRSNLCYGCSTVRRARRNPAKLLSRRRTGCCSSIRRRSATRPSTRA